MMEALIPLISSLLSSLFVDGLERGFAFGTLAGMAVFGVAVLFAMNAIRGKWSEAACLIRNTATIWWNGNFTKKV